MSSRGLGRGLNALFGEDVTNQNNEGQIKLKISEIEPNALQPRKNFDPEALAELTESIRQHGVLQPLAVRKRSEGYYQIIAGERRWRAARDAGLTEVPAYIIDVDDRKVMELALVENLQREGLNPIEEAEGYKTLVEEYGLTQEETAARVGKSRPAVANALRILSLSENLRSLISDGKISGGHAKALLAIPDKELQETAAKKVIEEGLNVRQAETLAKKLSESKKELGKAKSKGVTVNYLEEIERRLSSRLGRRIKLINGRSKGKIEIEYYGNEDLDMLITQLEALKKR